MHEAKTHLSRLLKRVEGGEEVVIARDGEPVAKLVSVRKRYPKVPGSMKGEIVIHPSFDDPLPAELWEGEI